MSAYTIQAGDNLTKIARQFYGDKLKTDEDCQKAINAIVEQNKDIKNPNLIYTGNKLNLLDVDSVFGTSASQAKETEVQPSKSEENGASVNIFTQLEQWEEAHEDLMALSITLEDYEIDREAIGTTFDFMEGKDVNDKEQYDEQTLKLAQGEIDIKDKDNNGTVSFIEYFSEEVGNEIPKIKDMISSGEMTQDEAISMISDIFIQSNKVFNLIDLMDSDGSLKSQGDSKLDVSEFQAYYQHLDEYTASPDGATLRDGIIDIDFVTEYPEYLAGQVPVNEEIEQSAQKIAMTLLGIK